MSSISSVTSSAGYVSSVTTTEDQRAQSLKKFIESLSSEQKSELKNLIGSSSDSSSDTTSLAGSASETLANAFEAAGLDLSSFLESVQKKSQSGEQPPPPPPPEETDGADVQLSDKAKTSDFINSLTADQKSELKSLIEEAREQNSSSSDETDDESSLSDSASDELKQAFEDSGIDIESFVDKFSAAPQAQAKQTSDYSSLLKRKNGGQPEDIIAMLSATSETE